MSRFVVRSAQAFRPHLRDMLEPQYHPDDRSSGSGQPVRPYDTSQVSIAPGQRVDLGMAMVHKPNSEFDLNLILRDREVAVARLVYSEESALRDDPERDMPSLAENGITKPTLASAEEVTLHIQGGAMGGMQSAHLGGNDYSIGELVDMPIDELLDFATNPDKVYTHKWREGDAVLWDNRAVVHRGRPFARDKHARVMIRTTIAGDRPTV